jgi:hypothetical protein
MPPSQRMNAPSGPRNSVSLPRNDARMPSANFAATPTTKSQFEVCGATMIIIFGMFGIVPSNRHPHSRSSVRPNARESALPRVGTWSPTAGT